MLGGLKLGPRSQRVSNNLTLAISGVCPGKSGFSSVICTSCSSVMVAWQHQEETPRLGRLPPHPPISSNTQYLLPLSEQGNAGYRGPGADDSRTQRASPAPAPCPGH